MGLRASALTRVNTIGYNPTVDVNMTRGLFHKVRNLTRDNIFKATPSWPLCKPIVDITLTEYESQAINTLML
jgi:hypothetical protein